MRLILSLCDHSGEWSRPYADAGYQVVRVDLKAGQDVRLMEYRRDVWGVLAAPPCTAFAGSGAQYWPAKDANGETLAGLALVDACLRVVAVCRPRWWALENPVGRLRRWLGPPRYTFHPCDHAHGPEDAYTKRTLLWGDFTIPARHRVEPVRSNAQGSWVQSLGGRSERTKTLRSITPSGFARDFFEANP